MALDAPPLGQEQLPEGEAEAIQQLAAISERQMQAKSEHPTRRDQHPKSHGYALGEFIVEDQLPEELRHGIFATPASYACWVRFSNGTAGTRGPDGRMIFLPDAIREGEQIRLIPDVRGMAIKLLGVAGEAVPEAAGRPGEQDLILMNSKVFFVKNVADYLPFFAVVKAIKDKVIRLDTQPPQIPPEFAESFARVGYALALANQIKQQPVSSPLQIRYWSASPYRLGEGAMKYAVVPRTTDPPFDPATAANPANVLREAIATHLASREAVFDVLVQRQSDPVAMPIEDPTQEWDESLAPFRKVATLCLPPQDINSPDRLVADERQSFSPWHSLAAHRPLGGVNRARRMYGDLARSRNRANATA
jgi:hypothetical protein